MEIFEQYFYDINQFSRTRQNNFEYSNMLDILNDKLDNFKISLETTTIIDNLPGYGSEFGSNLITGDNSTFDTGVGTWAVQADQGLVFYNFGNLAVTTLNGSGDGNITNVVNTVDTSSADLFKIRATIDTTNLAAGESAQVIFNNVFSQSVAAGNIKTIEFFASSSDDTTTIILRLNATVVAEGGSTATFDNIQVFGSNSSRVTVDDNIVYRLGSVMFTDDNNRTIEVQQVSKKEFFDINSSPLTKPSTKQPIFVKMSGNSLSLHPSSIASSTTVNFIRKPNTVNWAYNIVNEKALWNQTNTVNFELHESEETALVNRILELVGILLQKPELQASGKDKVVTEIQQEKA